MRPLHSLALASGTALLLLTIHSCSQVSTLASQPQPTASLASITDTSQAQASIVEGEPQPVGGGTARSYVELDAQNHPKAIGVILTETAIAALPNQTTEYVLPLPTQAATTAFTHIGLNWRSHGHEPSKIYDPPHFDVHFYTITPEARAAITAVGADLENAYKTPDPDLIPTGYVLAPDSADPQMGAHWVDPTSEEFHGNPHGFAHTLIYGFYNGEIAFIEPMVTLDFLKSQQAANGTFAVPQRYASTGQYPTGYHVTYNEATHEYAIALTGFNQL